MCAQENATDIIAKFAQIPGSHEDESIVDDF